MQAAAIKVKICLKLAFSFKLILEACLIMFNYVILFGLIYAQNIFQILK